MSELDIVKRLRQLAPAGNGVVLGIGDDCAIYRPRGGEELLFTSDQSIEGVHFLPEQAAAITGHNALARSLSDIAAMGGEPRFCLVSLSAREEKFIAGFYRGLLALARRTGTVVAGGDLAHSDNVYCDVTVCGSAPRGKALRRGGARVGDLLYVSGRLGRPWGGRIRPRLELGQALRGRATSCMDLSDGLALDLHRLCVESEVAAVLQQVPVMRGAALERALHGGEDYELLFTLPPGKAALPGTTLIGRIVKGKAGAVEFQGKPLAPRGYNHFG
ncbi:MAG: thiamine-phosphate kinase [Acidobacteriota bacterium]|nr:thiamine-phosphate kinase [Acidobacteriota bacterium]